jgi:hypothetical protein
LDGPLDVRPFAFSLSCRPDLDCGDFPRGEPLLPLFDVAMIIPLLCAAQGGLRVAKEERLPFRLALWLIAKPYASNNREKALSPRITL